MFISGDLLAARQLAEEASAQYAATNPLWAARFRVELARVYLYQGRSADVTALLKSPAPPDAEPELLVRRNLLLAMAEARLGGAGRSTEALTAAAALHPRGTLLAEMGGIQGMIALEQGRLDDAELLFQQALDGTRHQDAKFLEMEMWMNLGVVGLQRERYEDALEGFHHASALAQSIGARLALEKALGNLGWTYYMTGDNARALQNAEAARAGAAAIGATLDEVQWLTNAGQSQFQSNALAAARSSYESALALAQSLQNAQEILGAHIALAYLLLQQQPQAAEDHIYEAKRLAHLQQNAALEQEPLLLEALLLAQRGQAQAAEAALLQLVQSSSASPSLEWEAQNTLAGLYEKDGRQQEAELWFQRAIATFHRQRLSLKSVELQLPFLENGSDLYLGYMEHLIREGRTHDALNVLDGSRAETLAEGLGTSAPGSGGAPPNLASARTLAARLHGTILVYCLRPQASFLWAINASKEQFYTLPGSAAILPLVERHTQSILASKDLLAQQDSTGRQLFDALVKPAASLLGKGQKVYLIADKGLGALNFETLIPPASDSDARPHYWIEDVAVTNARSLRLLATREQHPRNAASQKMLLIGDPIYRPEEYPALPHAADEMTDVAERFPMERRSVFTGAQASPAVYATSSPGQFAFIHFVAHATANETNPLDSAIILSTPSNAPSEQIAPYKLYARDILQQPLHADLVTISSCYGSGTRSYSGEGVVGLVWAFLRAGAHSVIGATWEVSDVSTPQLMGSLYTHLLNGNTPDEALRSAKLAMLHGGGVFRKPLYWASFQLYTGR